MFIIGKMTNGGAERVINNLCNILKDEYNITLVVKSIEGADYVPDVNICEISELNSRRKKWIGVFKLRKLKKQLKIDTSISFLTKYNVYNYFYKYKDKIIFSVRNYMTENDTYSDDNLKLYKKIIKKADLVVNVSNSVMHDQFVNFEVNKKNNIVIPNFCEIDNINRLKIEKLDDDHKDIFKGNVIICPGRYTFQKGQWHIIRAFQKVVEFDKTAKLLLTSRGPLKEYYQTLVNELNLQNNVYILDFVDNIYRYMYNSKIYILNSFYEGMPNALLEAMACDLPVIATDSFGGTKEIIAPHRDITSYVDDITLEKYGILIPVCDRNMYSALEPLTNEENKIADAIIMLLKDKKLYKKYKDASSKRIKDFSKEKIIKMWKDIL